MTDLEAYFDTSTWDPRDVVSGGARMIPISTPVGDFRVWTRRVGTNPDLKVLLLHGGPGDTDELYECFDVHLPRAGIEYYFYDQLGSFRSDQPDDPSLWDLARFVDEVEQVRLALGLDSSNFVLLGQSWGGILAMEYAVHHQDALKGLVISNMMSSCPAYNAYARDVLMPQIDPRSSPPSRSSRPPGAPTTRGTRRSCSSTTTSTTCAGSRSRSGRSRWCAASSTSTRRSTSRCKDPASSGCPGRSSGGTARRTSRASTSPPS